MVMEATEKRKPRSYKATESVYSNAMKFAKKRQTTLAELVEDYVIRIAKIQINKNNDSPKTSNRKSAASR